MSPSWGTQVRLLDYHAGMLADRARVDAYRAALAEVVRDGDVVLDIGAGTGVLSYLAVQAGAARVYAIEAGPVVRLARQMAADSGYADRVTFLEGLSTELELPERADVLVTETLWNLGAGEGMIGFVADARSRLLEPGAAIVPSAVDMVIAPVQDDALWARLAARPPDRDGLAFGALRAATLSNVHTPKLGADAALAAPQVLGSLDLATATEPDLVLEGRFEVHRRGTLHGIGGWFDARLSESVRLSNAPPATDSSWSHAFFPLERAVAVQPGDFIEVRLATAGSGATWAWRTAVGGAVFEQSTFFGFPPDHERSARRASEARQGLNRHGQVVQRTLALIEAGATVAEIEADVHAEFGADVVRLVRRVAERYGDAR